MPSSWIKLQSYDHPHAGNEPFKSPFYRNGPAMSSGSADPERVQARDVFDKANTSYTSQMIGKHSAPAGTSEIPTPSSQELELEKHTATDHAPSEGHKVRDPAPLALAVLMTALCVSMFLVSLDRTIIATVSQPSVPTVTGITDQSHHHQAIPHITNQFHSYNDVGWYASAYLITACSFLPTYGRIYGLVNAKWTFLSGLFLFELGSLICGVAPSSQVLIAGRAIAGTGGAGIATGAYVVVAMSYPLQKRPLYAAIFGVMYVLLYHFLSSV